MTRMASRIPMPDVPFLLAFGVILGPVLHVLAVSLANPLTQRVITLGAALVLFQGGLGVGTAVLKHAWRSITLLSTVGVLVTAGVMTVCGHLLLGLPWAIAALLAVTVSNTDPATVISVLNQIGIAPLLRQTAEAESAFNDAVSSVLTMMLLALPVHSGWSVLGWFSRHLVEKVLLSLSVGIGVGAVFHVIVRGLPRGASAAPLALAGLVSYGLAHPMGASGYMAAFIAGITLGNAQRVLTRNSPGWEPPTIDGLVLISRILIFVVLGAAFPLNGLVHYGGQTLIFTGILMAVARPLTVLFSLGPDRRVRWRPNEMAFMVWIRETGVVSAVLAVRVALQRPSYRHDILLEVFGTILITVLLQSSTTSWMAEKLNVVQSPS